MNLTKIFRCHAPAIAVGACLLLLVGSIAFADGPRHASRLKPIIPLADRNDNSKVFLEHADSLVMDEKVSPDYMTLYGNVRFRKGGMFMYCDSAHFFDKTNSLDAFGNVRMEQGDTLFIYGNELSYNGMTEHAVLYGGGRKARLINRDVKLETDIFHYDMVRNVGYYDVGGVLSDKVNRLKSIEGEYYPNTKQAYFYYNVDLFSPRAKEKDTLRMFTDSLTYNTQTNIAHLIAPTRIINRDGRIITSSGDYNTRSGVADLYSRSTVFTNRGNTLTGDTLFYDRQKGIGEAFGNMILTDSVNSSNLYGDYGFYDEFADSAFVTGHALAKEFSRKDTLYLHGDTINAYRQRDSVRITNAFHRVRFYRKDMQGLCDSMSIREDDSTMYMYRHPMVWSGDRQIYGNEIRVHFNDSTADRAYLPNFGIMSEHIAEDCYNQLAGKQMTAWLADSTITRLYVEGNVQAIMFPMEQDSTYNKYAYVESSYMDAHFTDNDIDSVRMWPETTGSVTPLYLAKKGAYHLPSFKWYADVLRPTAPDEVFDYPPEMEALMSAPEPGRRQRRPQSDESDDDDTDGTSEKPEESTGSEPDESGGTPQQ